MKRLPIVVVSLSLLIGFYSIYINIQGLYNQARLEDINQMFVESEDIVKEDLFYYLEGINVASTAISINAWIIIVLTLINCIVGCSLFFKLKKIEQGKFGSVPKDQVTQ